MTQDTRYIVTWQIDIEAPNHREAAKKALEIRRRWDSVANIFDVRADFEGIKEARRIDLNIPAHEAAMTILIEACSKDMESDLANHPDRRETIVKEGFSGFGNMVRYELIQWAQDAGLDKKSEDVRWAIEELS